MSSCLYSLVIDNIFLDKYIEVEEYIEHETEIR